MNNKKYAFCGAHCTGKSTLLNVLKPDLERLNINIIDDSSNARKLKTLGYQINDTGNNIVEYIVAGSHISNFAKIGNWFADRCIIDGTAYALQAQCDEICKQNILNMCHLFKNEYTHIFYIPIEFDMVSDGVRKIDNEYRQKIDSTMKGILDTIPSKVSKITGSVEERYHKVLSIISLYDTGYNNL